MTPMSDEQNITLQKAIEAASKFGAFLTRVFGGSLENIGEIAEQHTAYWKYKNALGLQDKVEAEIARRKLDGRTVIVPPRFGIPLLEAAVQEDNDEIQKFWSNLLVSAMDPGTEKDVKKSYIEIVKQFDPLDAKILNMLFNLDSVANKGKQILIKGWYEDELSTALSLRNLERLGLIEFSEEKTENSAQVIFTKEKEIGFYVPDDAFFFHLSIKALGWHLLRVCTNQRIQHEKGEIMLIDWDPVKTRFLTKHVSIQSHENNKRGQ